MKRLIPILAMMILCLWPLLSMAEGEASGGLFPAEDENGKWGYVNEDGEFVIPAQFDHAFGFRGGYAEIVVFPEEYTGDRSPYFCGYSGLIDREGRIVLDPVWSIDAGYDEEFYGGLDSGIWIVMAGADDRDNDMEGWFDIGSGYFSGLVWEGVWPWVEDGVLIPVTDDTDRAGYADRTTGELVIPCRYQCVDPSPFSGGIASVSLEEEEYDETGNRACSVYFLIDETGEEIPLPEGIFAVPYEGAHDGRVMVADRADANWYYPDDDALFGYADTQGNLVIEPRFISARPFADGLAAVQFPEGDWGLIDPSGKVTERGLEEPEWQGEVW